MDVQGKVVIITGASMGIGEATARVQAEAGAKLVLAAEDVARKILQAAITEPIEMGMKDQRHNHSDAPYLSPIGSQIGFTSPIDGQRGLDIINAYSLAFFDKELKGQPSPLLDGSSNQFPEVIFSSKDKKLP